MKQYRDRGDPLAGADVVLVGLFSGNEKQYPVLLDELASLAEARGARVVARFVQRRGASDQRRHRPGGASRMSRPYSRRMLLSHGKVREIAEACREAEVTAAVFVNVLTPRQRKVLTELLGCLVFTRDELT
ncbi:hypothetical protein [Actinoplanes rectilineatus]|uniref:HflX-like GTP-binding protein n=1 Tax=Actinoplanes rectilineatus TaxID=113571 RepID=UPI0005F2EBE9|nr:hypothetical protein [Actinoplanes rectilineatus]